MLKGMRHTSGKIELGAAAVLGVMALGVASFAFAQNQAGATRAREREAPAAATATRAPPAGVMPGDHLLAAWLIVDNDNEVELAQIAEKKAQNKDVKDFAKQMAQEHEQLVQKLEKFGGPSMRRDRGAPGERNARTRGQAPAAAGTAPATGTQTRTTARPIHPAGQIDTVALKQQLGEQCLQTARRELEKKSGAEFDKCFMEMQVFAHLQQIDEMEVFATHASPELQQVVEQGRKTAEEHLKHARDLLQKVSGSSEKSDKSDRNESKKS